MLNLDTKGKPRREGKHFRVLFNPEKFSDIPIVLALTSKRPCHSQWFKVVTSPFFKVARIRVEKYYANEKKGSYHHSKFLSLSHPQQKKLLIHSTLESILRCGSHSSEKATRWDKGGTKTYLSRALDSYFTGESEASWTNSSASNLTVINVHWLLCIL